MVVDHAGGLHEGVADGGSDEVEAAGLEGFAQAVGPVGCGREILENGSGGDADGVGELPEEFIEGAEFFDDRQGGAGVLDGGIDLGAIADDAGVEEETFNVVFVKSGHAGDVEVVEEQAVALATVEDGAPGEAGLGAFETDELEEVTVAVNGDAPLEVVILAHEGVVIGTEAAVEVGGGHSPFLWGSEKPGGARS